MSNLIITIIAIALVAVAALATIFYGGTAFTNNADQARASMLIQQTKQIYAAALQYGLSINNTNFDDLNEDAIAIARFTTGRLPILNLPTVNNLDIATLQSNALNSQALPPLAIDGYTGLMRRALCQINGVNKVLYMFFINEPYNGNRFSNNGDFAAASSATHPIVRMCLKINAKANLPSGLTYAASGLPYAQGAEHLGYCAVTKSVISRLGSGDGYCYLYTTSGSTYAISLHFSN